MLPPNDTEQGLPPRGGTAVVTVQGNRSNSIAALAAALAKAQGEMAGASKDSLNPHFKAKYASLASVWDACRGALSKNGLSVLQPCRADGASVTVTTILAHDSGEWISEDLTVTAQTPTPQGIGSALTYCRRYSLASMVGIAPEDDDGEEASSEFVTLSGRETPEHNTASRAPQPPVTRAATPPEQRAQASGNGSSLLISEKQASRLYAIAKKAHPTWTGATLNEWLKEVWRIDSSQNVPRKDYEAIVTAVEGYVETPS